MFTLCVCSGYINTLVLFNTDKVQIPSSNQNPTESYFKVDTQMGMVFYTYEIKHVYWKV